MRIVNILLALGIVGAAAGIGYSLFATRPRATQAALEERALPVDVQIAEPTTHPVTVRAMGEVKAASEVLLQPEVSGKILALSPNLVPGGRVSPNELLVRVDRRDYSSLLAAQQAALEQARVRKREEQSLAQIAEHEWQGAKVGDEARELALRQPHLKSAAAGVQSAQRQVERARRNVKRTGVLAPFAGVVLEEYVDLGQVVAPGVAIARIAGTDKFWVQASVRVAELGRLTVPGSNTDELRGSRATIILEPEPGVRIEREGTVERLLGAVDSRGRMAQLLIAVDDPLDLTKPASQRSLPLLIGAFVRVELEGRSLNNAVAVPIEALEDEDRLWVVVDDKLKLRDVQVAWRDRERAIITAGLDAGDRIVVSPVPTAAPGMPAAIEREITGSGDGPVAAAAPG